MGPIPQGGIPHAGMMGPNPMNMPHPGHAGPGPGPGMPMPGMSIQVSHITFDLNFGESSLSFE